MPGILSIITHIAHRTSPAYEVNDHENLSMTRRALRVSQYVNICDLRIQNIDCFSTSVQDLYLK